MKHKGKVLIVLFALALTGWPFGSQISLKGEPIRVGILHSLTGTMAISETSVAQATVMAIEEINQQGGLLGSEIEPMVVDGRSDWPTFSREAERLITDKEVSVIFEVHTIVNWPSVLIFPIRIRPVPYPIFRLRSEWDTFLQDLYRAWGGKWVNPGA